MEDQQGKAKTEIEIEAPTDDQRAEALVGELIEFAESGAPEIQIISKLMARGVPKEEAERQMAHILEAAKGKRRVRALIRKVGGGSLALGGFGFGIYALIGGVFWVWPFLIGIGGVALFSGYLDSVLDVF